MTEFIILHTYLRLQELILPKNFPLDQSLLIDPSKFLDKCESLEAAWDDKSLLEFLITKTRQAQALPSCIANYANRLSIHLGCHSPIRRLPPEVLTKIFTFIVEANPVSFGEYHGPNSYPTLKTLSHVCSLWRDLIVSQSIFWSFMSVNIGGYTPAREDYFKKCVIPHSGSTPLNISLNSFHYYNSQLDLQPGGGIVKELAAHGARWKTLKLSFFPNFYMHQLETMLKSELTRPKDATASASLLPLLESLTIHTGTDLDVLRNVKLFICCPCLRELHMESWWSGSMLDAIDVRNLTILESTEVLLDSPIVDLLKRCPLLQTLTVGKVWRVSAPPPECFFHRHLTTLNISDLDGIFAKEAWKSVRLPNLACLNIVIHTMSTTSVGAEPSVKHALDALTDMLICSGCSLRRASYELVKGESAGLQGASMNTDYLRTFLKNLPMTRVQFRSEVLWTPDSKNGRTMTSCVYDILSSFFLGRTKRKRGTRSPGTLQCWKTTDVLL